MVHRLTLLLLGLFGAAISCDAVPNLPVDRGADTDRSGEPPARDRGENPIPTEKPDNGVNGGLDFAPHVAALKKRFPPPDFHIVVEPPFVVIGDQSRSSVERWSRGTVRWAVEKLKQGYFAEDPDHIIDIWLFRNRGSYMKNAKRLFGSVPTTPFGYYSPGDKALVMNISTGGGTLVHEIVHPFMAANFGACPAWLNEGLGSLYEQSSEREGRIVGLTNWRLAGLQEAIAKKRVPSFEVLTSTTTAQFYGEDPGTNYSQARYLCYYLQERRLLRKFYRAFAASPTLDPTGYKTLVRVLGCKDMADFEREWRNFVLQLRFD